mmetsp:Transcript_39447/g.113365  ORF Transcript_39447/g.113365 Transcript_39447/m.113365 type:complete len:86 (-) Transcript_39447:58-315(-)
MEPTLTNVLDDLTRDRERVSPRKSKFDLEPDDPVSASEPAEDLRGGSLSQRGENPSSGLLEPVFFRCKKAFMNPAQPVTAHTVHL